MIGIVVNGIAISLEAGQASESIEYEGGITDTRRHGGSLVRMHHWSKPVITISGSGARPAELASISPSDAVTVYLAGLQSAASATTTIMLTSVPRPDFQPVGYGMVGGRLIKTACSVSAGIATLSPVVGATQYRVDWMPQFTIYPDPVSSSISEQAMYGWTLKGKAV